MVQPGSSGTGPATWFSARQSAAADDQPGGPADEGRFLHRSAVEVAVEALRQEYSLLEASAVADDHLRYA